MMYKFRQTTLNRHLSVTNFCNVSFKAANLPGECSEKDQGTLGCNTGHTAGVFFTHRTCDLLHRNCAYTISTGTVKTLGIYSNTTVY